MLRARVFPTCPFQQHWVGDRLSPLASLSKVHELRVALFNFCSLLQGKNDAVCIFFYGAKSWYIAVLQWYFSSLSIYLPAFTPLPLTSSRSSFPSSVIYRNRILRNVFCLWFFNCLSGRCIHQANQGELHLPRAQNLNGGITEFRIWRDVVSFPSNFPERLPPACVHIYV